MKHEPSRWALDTLREELIRAETAMPQARQARPATRAVAIVAVGVLAAFIALTPPGRALAEDVAELVGIGDEPTVDRESQEAPVVATDDEVVVATGTTPSGERYEMAAFIGTREVPLQPGEVLPPSGPERPDVSSGLEPDAGTCFVLDYPEAHRPYGTSICTRSGIAAGTSRPGFNEARQGGPDSSIQMEATTGPEVEGVEVTFRNEAGKRVPAPVAFGRLTEELAARIGAPAPMGRYVAFLPASLFPDYDAPAMGTLEVTAYGAEGEVVDHLDYGPIYEDVHERNLEAECMQRKLEPISDLKPGERLPKDAPTLTEIQRACRR